MRWKAASSTKKYSTPSRSPGRGCRVVCETEKRRSGTRASTRCSTVDFPVPEGPETTIRLARASLNVLHLLAQPLDLGLEADHLAHQRRRGGLAADRVRLARQL